MATWTPETKNTATFENQNITGYADWADTVATWTDVLYGWGKVEVEFTEETKSSTIFTNETKN